MRTLGIGLVTSSVLSGAAISLEPGGEQANSLVSRRPRDRHRKRIGMLCTIRTIRAVDFGHGTFRSRQLTRVRHLSSGTSLCALPVRGTDPSFKADAVGVECFPRPRADAWTAPQVFATRPPFEAARANGRGARRQHPGAAPRRPDAAHAAPPAPRRADRLHPPRRVRAARYRATCAPPSSSGSASRTRGRAAPSAVRPTRGS